MKPELTQERLLEVLDYNSETGHFTWKVRTGPRGKAGSKAGTPHKRGYWKISIDGKIYSAHRLAWLYAYGRWPTDQLDHINHVKDDNRLANLREASQTLNQENKIRARADSKTGLLGVSQKTSGRQDRWIAQICVDKKIVYLGSFDDPDVAHQVYLRAKRDLHAGSTLTSESRD